MIFTYISIQMKIMNMITRPLLFKIAIGVIILTALYSCSTKMNQADMQSLPADTIASPHTFLALGDSYTIGQSVAIQDRFPNQAVQLLHGQNISVADPDIIATTGWTTRDLLNALDASPPRTDYTLVTLLIGVNNQYQGRSIAEYTTEFTDLLNRAIQYAANRKNRVFVLSIPDYSVTPFAASYDTARIAREIDQFNAVNKSISLQMGVTWIDITGISREAKNDPTLIAGDGLHPSGLQYKRWDDLLVPKLKQSLQ